MVESVPAVKPSSPPLSGQTLAWGDAGDSSVPLSPNRVQAGRSQDVPQEGSLFHVSPVSNIWLAAPSSEVLGVRRCAGIGSPLISFTNFWVDRLGEDLVMAAAVNLQ